MTGPNTALALMVRPRKPTRGTSHILLEDIADTLFRGPAKTTQGIDLLVKAAEAQCFSQANAVACIPDVAVPHLLEGPDGATGLIVFDGILVDALIEQQTLGRISAAPRVDRPVTAIDAALSTAFASAVVAKLAQVCADRRDASALAGFSCGAPQTDRAALSLALSDRAYDVLQLSVDLGPGIKSGRALLMFPAVVTVAQPKPKRVNPAMVAILQDSPLKLEAFLPSIRLPVSTLLGLETDSVISLPNDILTRAQLRDSRNTTLGKGRLGQLNGRRALRLETPHADRGKLPVSAASDLHIDDLAATGADALLCDDAKLAPSEASLNEREMPSSEPKELTEQPH
ncbi:FliM/FliN family flagellar motor C-terminal domain-containing protein [Litoreibacter janthinus]|uniref:Type III flagellar switch regulator (C-ring) FliN C-term n=1 Tax=Litoreibacter janthinus TaxID=670154 RepID=A0A1I6HBL7_9RHOB|nr:FliM/FliN family flagellar motor C-terminal domain-containing protein [Litoreibacter janthinus]SFR51778.1 Type III flagellar switch regulator (C-ring) FliN C-term [Litoreibacter janthinus]